MSKSAAPDESTAGSQKARIFPMGPVRGRQVYTLYPLEQATSPDNRKHYVVEIALDDVTLTGVMQYALCTTFMPDDTYSATFVADEDSAAVATRAVTGIRILRELSESDVQEMAASLKSVPPT